MSFTTMGYSLWAVWGNGPAAFVMVLGIFYVAYRAVEGIEIYRRIKHEEYRICRALEEGTREMEGGEE